MLAWRMRRHGTTTVELVVVVTLVTLVAAIGVPSLVHIMDRGIVERAAQQLVQAHQEARMAALTSSRIALLTLSADSLVLRTTSGRDTTLVWRRPGPRALGVEVEGPVHLFRFIPFGYTIGASNATYVVRRGAALRRVVIARYGRVQLR